MNKVIVITLLAKFGKPRQRSMIITIASNKKKDPFGKKFFHNVPITINDQFHVALMSPVLHYTMGGIDIYAESEVRDMQEQVIPGLFASGK
ncbi:hypothetical protein C2G38_1250343 [Gigaspora rosea]|uniref:FAD-dependent oxidoreductase 2 FAD-binding domain-containing protein n=1 Tax=Gigaspora rosea TaxID=44941 RepID=A0A397WBB9_9GLOM|nr:hypothetical protein C2G38_1250343 [Gigaspora rosea]